MALTTYPYFMLLAQEFSATRESPSDDLNQTAEDARIPSPGSNFSGNPTRPIRRWAISGSHAVRIRDGRCTQYHH